MTDTAPSHAPAASGAGKPAGAVEVFYDGSCPLCVREIGFYQRCKGADAIEWVDVSDPVNATAIPDLDRETAMARFHVRTADGTLTSGAQAFSDLWKALPGWKRAGTVAGAWGIRHVLEAGYRGFLVFRPALQNLASRLEPKSADRDHRETK